MTWKAWSAEPGDPLMWEMRRVCPSMRFTVDRTPLHRIIKKQLPKWRALWEDMGWEDKDVFGMSGRSMIGGAKGAQELLGLQQEFWVSTAGLLAVLVDGATARKAVGDREFLVWLGRLFLEKTGPQEGQGVAMMIAADAAEQCHKEPRQEGHCICVQRFLTQECDEVGHFQFSTWDKLLLVAKHKGCKAICLSFGRALADLAGAIDHRASVWGVFEWVQTKDAQIQGPKRRRRMDHHLRTFITHRGVFGDRHKNSAEAARSVPGAPVNVFRLQEKELAIMRAGMLLGFADVSSLHLCWDGVRLGNPAKEFLLGAVSDPAKNLHAVLPPQDGGH